MTAIAHLIRPKTRDLGDGLTVRRILPAIEQRSVGPFVFLDHIGPVTFQPGVGMDVRPHPHIGLATVTYLFEGEILHRDSLGYVQPIRPGDVHWLTAGPAGAKTMLLGGAAMDGPRHMWWNFVSSSKERIEQAKAEWRAQSFGKVPGETEFIPLPER